MKVRTWVAVESAEDHAKLSGETVDEACLFCPAERPAFAALRAGQHLANGVLIGLSAMSTGESLVLCERHAEDFTASVQTIDPTFVKQPVVASADEGMLS